MLFYDRSNLEIKIILFILDESKFQFEMPTKAN